MIAKQYPALRAYLSEKNSAFNVQQRNVDAIKSQS